MALPLVLAAVGAGLKGIGSIVSAFSASKQSKAEDDYNQAQYNLQADSIALQNDQIQLQTESDVNSLKYQQNQQIGNMKSAAAASGIVTSQSSFDNEIDYENDQFLTAIEERQTLGELQLQQNANQLASLGLQLQYSKDQNKQARNASWLSSALGVASSAASFISGGFGQQYGGGWYQAKASKG